MGSSQNREKFLIKIITGCGGMPALPLKLSIRETMCELVIGFSETWYFYGVSRLLSTNSYDISWLLELFSAYQSTFKCLDDRHTISLSTTIGVYVWCLFLPKNNLKTSQIETKIFF